jgi:RNA polymerase sigma-70 factor (ECF subfamily)
MKKLYDHILEETQILLAQDGDIESFERLIQKYHPKLIYYVRRLTNDEEATKDVLQNVWLEVYHQLRTLRSHKAFSVWVYRIARNKAVEFVRRRQHDAFEDIEIETIPDKCDEPKIEIDNGSRLHKALQELKPEHREVLVLCFFEEMSYEQIADVINSPIGTVRSRIYHAKLNLKKQLEVIHD